MPSPRATSTPATTGVDSTLRDTTPWRFPKFKIRRRGDFPLPPAPSPSHEAHSPRRASMPAFPVSQEEHLCRWRSRHDVLLRTWARAGLECSTLTSITRRDIPLHRLSCLVYYCLVCCLPPASCRPEQDTPILALPRRRRRRCTRIAFGCAQDIRTTNEGRLYHFTYYHEELLYLVSAYRPVLHQQSERETCL